MCREPENEIAHYVFSSCSRSHVPACMGSAVLIPIYTAKQGLFNFKPARVISVVAALPNQAALQQETNSTGNSE